MAIVAAIAAVYSASEQRKQRKATQKAADVERKEAEAERLRQRQKAVAEARRLRAKSQATAIDAGVGTTSTVVQQSTGAITSQLASNLGFLSQMENLETQKFGYLNQARSHGGKAATASAVGSAAGSFG